MKFHYRDVCRSLFVMGALFAVSAASAQVSDINSARLFPRTYNDDPTSVLVSLNTYPALISFNDQSVDKNGVAGGFANRHVWYFSKDSGVNAYRFQNNDFFEVFMDVTLVGTPNSPRKEAGFLLDTIGGQGQFIVNTDAHEVVAFGGPFPFYAFPATFDSGETIRLGMTYFRDLDGKRKVIYHAGSQSSPAKEFTNLEQGIINQSRLGGYVQIVIDNANPLNSVSSEYRNITIQAIRTVTGTVQLESCVDMTGAVVTFEFRPQGGGAIFTQTAELSNTGAFTLPRVPAGKYTVNVKGDRWLAKNITIDASAGDVSNVNVGLLLGGDATNDNSVDVLDLDALISAFDATPSDSNWNGGIADFNCDDSVDVLDLDILIRNFDAQGAQ